MAHAQQQQQQQDDLDLVHQAYQNESWSVRLWYLVTQPLDCLMLPASMCLRTVCGPAKVNLFRTDRMRRFLKHPALDTIVQLNAELVCPRRAGANPELFKGAVKREDHGATAQLHMRCNPYSGRLYAAAAQKQSPGVTKDEREATATVTLSYHRSNRGHTFMGEHGIPCTVYPETYSFYAQNLTSEIVSMLVRCEYLLNGQNSGQIGWFDFVASKVGRMQDLYGIREAMHWNAVYSHVLGDIYGLSALRIVQHRLEH